MFYVKQPQLCRHTGINRVQKQSRAKKTLTSRTSCLSIYTQTHKLVNAFVLDVNAGVLLIIGMFFFSLWI